MELAPFLTHAFHYHDWSPQLVLVLVLVLILVAFSQHHYESLEPSNLDRDKLVKACKVWRSVQDCSGMESNLTGSGDNYRIMDASPTCAGVPGCRPALTLADMPSAVCCVRD